MIICTHDDFNKNARSISMRNVKYTSVPFHFVAILLYWLLNSQIFDPPLHLQFFFTHIFGVLTPIMIVFPKEEFQSKCIIAVQIVAIQPLIANKAEPGVEAKRCAIANFTFKNHLVIIIVVVMGCQRW